MVRLEKGSGKLGDDVSSTGKGGKHAKGDKGNDKGGKKGSPHDGKGVEKGEKGGKGARPEKLVKQGLRGKITKLFEDKPSGFIQRLDGGGKDVYFDLADVVGEDAVELFDLVDFDIVEGRDQRFYAARVKKLPKDTPEENRSLKSSTPLTASKAGSLTGGGISLGPAGGKKPGSLTGGLSLRPGSALSPGGSLTGGLGGGLRPGGGLGGSLGSGGSGLVGESRREDAGKTPGGPSCRDDGPVAVEDEEGEEDGVEWGRVVSTRERFGFLHRLGGSAGVSGDVFFRAADVVGMNSSEPGEAGKGIEITLPHGRNSNGFKSFWLNVDDEVSYVMSKDHLGKPCAVDIRKERKGAWRTGRRACTGPRSAAVRRESLKDQMKRLIEMDADQVLHNASLFKEILESPEFNPSHLCKIISLLASKELVEDTRSDSLYRIFLDSSAMQTSLRTTIIKHSAGKHSGNFLEECLKCLVEVVLRHPSPQELRGQLPLVELVEAWEVSVREGSSATKKGLPDDIKQMLLCLQKKFPDEMNLDRVLGVRAKKEQRSAAEDYTELLEADYYQDMPILPTSAEMLGQCAFEIQENMRTYEKCEDYIQTHFMLLREDYIEPLRAGIKLFMQGRHSPKDLHVYTGVRVVGMLSTWEGVVYRVELPKAQIRSINWEKSKQLMYGSLLCLSDDSFETLIWATVWRRDAERMATEAQLDIRLPFEPFDDRLSPGKTFCCIENVTIYFEAYRHVLIALQSLRPTDVPFQHTLMSPQPEPIPPMFLKAESDMFHFHNVFASCEKVDAPVNAPKSFKVLQEWPPTLLQSLDIDPSQLAAIQHALTHAMALIQGPPGTGKTWVGLKIVQALLDNTREVRHSPILVVCYTNHALDQFLEGIFKFCERIARIGSRSKSELMKSRNLKELVGELQPSKEYFQARKGLMDRRDRLREEFAKLLETVDSHTVDAMSARALLSERQFQAFYDGYLEYLGESAVKVTSAYEDADAVDDELWDKMMRAWLETSNLEKFAPVQQRVVGGLPTLDQLKGDDESDDDVDKKAKQIIDDAEEEEAEHEQHDRKLDVEQVEPKKPGTGDFCAEIKNAWLPYWDDHLDKMRPEMRSFNWQEEGDQLWRLPREQRRETYRQWLLENHHEAREQLPEIARQLERNAESRAALERDRKLELLREMEVVGMTTTAVSKYQVLLKELRPEVVIVEEAAEVLEAHILTALHPRTQHVILIGDHQQLRPSTAVYRLSKCFHLDVSLFERLIKNGADHVTLLQQRRMHPKISRLIRPYYPELRDHSSTSNYPEIMGVDARTFFLRHNSFEDDEGESHSKSNTFEANFISALCSHLVVSGYEESQITVLSPYLGQVRTLKAKMRRDPSIMNVLVTAVDNYQGEENDIIVISLVRSNRNRSMGFLAVENRINVALTRARHGMFIVGNADMLRGHKLWESIMNELHSDRSIAERMPLIDKTTGGVFEVKNADDISVLLDNPLHRTSGEGDTFPNRGNSNHGAVAERWAELGKDDKIDSRGPKGRDRRERLTLDEYRDRDRGSSGVYSGGYDDRASRARGSQKSGRDLHGGDAIRESRGRAEESSGNTYPVVEEEGFAHGHAPHPSKMEADGTHPESQLVPSKFGDASDNGSSDVGKRVGKKKQKPSNKVVMRWG
mmetsp:Transcript_122692/g.308566  ORF Transcript_122692/g.308566 Transcript_122692/m.308566 type:complete len:1646 (-) Transcript_122692:74-5011(-)